MNAIAATQLATTYLFEAAECRLGAAFQHKLELTGLELGIFCAANEPGLHT